MSSVVLSGDTSGTITVSAPAVAGSSTQTLAAVTGTLAPIVSGTAVTASGTSVDFTGIPSWVKRITVMFNNVSTTGTSLIQLQLGSGSVQNTGYNGMTGSFASTTPATSSQTTGFFVSNGGAAADFRNGNYVFTNLSGNIWTATGQFAVGTFYTFGAGQVALSGTLDRVRITTVNGTDTFDNGSINILYE